jgi:hypothetical protein
MGPIATNVGLVVVILMTATLLAELMLKLMEITYQVLMAYDNVRVFSANHQGAKGWLTKEGRRYVTINTDVLLYRKICKTDRVNWRW